MCRLYPAHQLRAIDQPFDDIRDGNLFAEQPGHNQTGSLPVTVVIARLGRWAPPVSGTLVNRNRFRHGRSSVLVSDPQGLR